MNQFMRKTFLSISLLLVIGSAHAQYGGEKLQFSCNAATSSFRLGFEDDAIPLPVGANPADTRKLDVPPPGASSRLSPGGSNMRLPGKPLRLKCGKLELRVSSSYLNLNPDGELGIVEFDSVEVLKAGKRILSRTGFATCDAGSPRWDYFGECPKSYAQAMLVEWDDRASRTRIKVKRLYNEAPGGEDGKAVIENIESP